MSGTPRILIIDDNRAIHDDFHRILSVGKDSSAPPHSHNGAKSSVLAAPADIDDLALVSAYDGMEAFELARQAEVSGASFAGAFIDYRIRNNTATIEAVQALWKIAPHLEVAICTAFAAYSPSEIGERLGHSNHLVVMRKPFDPIEVVEAARRMVGRWRTRVNGRESTSAALNRSSESLS